MKWTIEKWINTGLFLALVILAVTGVVSFWSVRNLISTTRMVSHTSQVLENLEDV